MKISTPPPIWFIFYYGLVFISHQQNWKLKNKSLGPFEHGDLVIGATRIWWLDWTFLCPDRSRFNLMWKNEKWKHASVLYNQCPNFRININLMLTWPLRKILCDAYFINGVFCWKGVSHYISINPIQRPKISENIYIHTVTCETLCHTD